MKAVILHSEISVDSTVDEQDSLVQVEAVSSALSALGISSRAIPFSIDVKETVARLKTAVPDVVFNLVETVEGSGRLIHMAPALLDHLGMDYTGAATEPMFLTSNKLLAKQFLRAASIPTPLWVSIGSGAACDSHGQGPYIIKSVWEHASIGIGADSVITPSGAGQLISELKMRRGPLGGDCFAEAFIDGREFNLSLLASAAGPEVLPPAEILFDSFPEGSRRIVGYSAKWESDSFEYQNTPRSFHFPESDGPLIDELTRLAQRCWSAFGLRGYARVDFRVDQVGRPWVLEVNCNPCLSPDAGFAAAAHQAGIGFPEVIRRIVEDRNVRSDRKG